VPNNARMGFYGRAYAKQRSTCTFITHNQPYLGVRIIYTWVVNNICCTLQSCYRAS